MGVLPDWMIERDIGIEPFSPQQNRPGVISYGVTSYGYDVRLGYKIKVFTPHRCTGAVINPKNLDMTAFEEIDLTPGEGVPDHIIMPPHSFILGESLEVFRIPRDILVLVVGKSTLARCGLIVNVTPGEPEWTGKWTIEVSNTAPMPVQLFVGEGIMQCVFLRSDGVNESVLNAVKRLCGQTMQRGTSLGDAWLRRELHAIEKLLIGDLPRSTCRTSYKDKKGKYQNQTGVTLPVVK